MIWSPPVSGAHTRLRKSEIHSAFKGVFNLLIKPIHIIEKWLNILLFCSVAQLCLDSSRPHGLQHGLSVPPHHL